MSADTVGGVWVHALELASALGEHGVEITLATMGAPLSGAQRREVGALCNVQVRESRYKLEWMDAPWDDVERSGEWLLALEGEVRPDVVHLNGFAHGALPWRAPVVVAGHSCVASWWEAVKGEPLPGEWEEYRRRVRAGLRGADVVVAPSYAMHDALQRHHGPLTRAHVVLNGRSGPFRPAEKEPFVITAGRLWDEGKNVAALARIAADLPWPVYVAGRTMSPDGQSAALGALRPLGHLAPGELAGWLGRASIYALPARYEPFGLSVVEAALSGCALVLGDIGSLRELWGDAAAYVDPDDDAALARAVEWLCADPTLRRALADRARRRALEMTPRRMADGYLAVYASAAAHHGARREAVACAS